MTESKKKIDLPFKIVKSEVSGGFINSVHTAFTGGIDISNYHEDKYGHFENDPLQSPFTQTWVGGKSHRHVPLNDGLDNSETRLEAWHLDFYSDGVRFYSHKKRNSPPSYWTREELAKRPLNIKNIKNTGSYIGNYNKNYEVIQTSGRRITNNLIVDGFIADGALTTQFVTGTNNYRLPELNSVTGSKSVIVERFNAPGSKEESSRGALDREGEEMSPNISLPFRNIRLRNTFYKQLSKATPQFGGTIHNVNRNTLVRAGNTQEDNGFVTHAIPRTDIQYSWISSSTYVSASELGGYQSFGDNYNRSEAYSDIVFNSGSLTISGSSKDYFLDNFGINSLVKNTKTINLETNLFSISSSLSSSFSEYTNSPYSFTTWTSIRTGEHPVARTLRKNNIISIQEEPKEKIFSTRDNKRIFVKPRRSQESLNFIEPPVTFKYSPLRHRFRFKGVTNEETAHELTHTYTNIFSTFSNKELSEKLLKPEEKDTFYNLVYEYYANPEEQEANPIDKLLGYTYTETIWPREENTGLSKTRKRSEYFLDKPGFTRDGYDIRLGTQRAFWRNRIQDRKRSKNSEGGYYSSIGYLSTEETGSNFEQYETGVLIDNKYLLLSALYDQKTSIDDGLFNSISLLENSSTERELFSYTGKADYFYVSSIGIRKNLGSIHKRGYVFDTLGEFNNSYTNFYEQIFNDNDGYRKSLGTLYENTSYKSLLTLLPQERSLYEDYSPQIEDEELFVNPKLKYVSFIGGGELNTGSFFQDENNFSTTLSASSLFIDDKINTVYVDQSNIYIGGVFGKVGDIVADKTAFFNKSSAAWSAIGGTLPTDPNAIISSGSTVYVGGGNYFRFWSGTSWDTLVGDPNLEVYSIALSGSDIYVGGFLNSIGGTTVSKIARWDGVSWNAVGTNTFSGVMRAITVSGNDIYIGGNFSDSVSIFIRGIARWDGASWNALGTGIVGDVRSIVVSGSHVYAGGDISPYDIVKWDGATWSGIGKVIGGGALVNSIVLSGSDIYAAGSFSRVESTNAAAIAKYNIQTEQWSPLREGVQYELVESMFLSGSDLYVAGNFEFADGKLASKIAKYDTIREKWSAIEENSINHDKFSLEYYNETVVKEDIYFSTLDKGLKRTTEESSGKKPFFDSYEDFIEDVRAESKEYSIIPEFKISEHMDYYVSSRGGNFRAKNKKLFSLDGGSRHNSATNEESENYDEQFLKIYSTSDILKKHDDIKKENEDVAEIEKINLTVTGIKKMLPYNGFYPQDRTTQIANLYSDYVTNNLHGGTYNLSYRTDFTDNAIINNISVNPKNISAIKYDQQYFAAVAIPTSRQVRVYRTTGEDPTQPWPISELKTITGPSSSPSSDFGRQAQLVSASNGLNLFISGYMTGSVTGTPGYLFICSSSNGDAWSTPEPLEVYGTSPPQYISGSSDNSQFGWYFDAIYDDNNQEKMLIVIGSRQGDIGGTNSGEVYVVTGTLDNNQWRWSDKNLIHTGSASSNNAGTGVSMISCSSGYQLFFGESFGDSPVADIGNILVCTSTDGSSWTTPTIIASGSTNTGTQYQIGINGIEAVDFNEKTYLFFSIPDYDSYVGAVFCITSSAGNIWPSSTTYLDKKLIYKTDREQDLALSFTLGHHITVFSGSDQRLYYAFANEDMPYGEPAELAIGYTDTSGYFQTTENNLILRIAANEGFNTVGVAPYSIGEYSLPVFITHKDGDLRAVRNSLFTEFSLRVTDNEKYYKHAALEPFMAPGILYNTIKSGVAVDWPCATGSNTAIVPYGGSTIVNAYYPKSFEMASFSGSNIYESMYGQVRSNIDYRIPFENILFPNEAFKVKEYLEDDLISRTVLSTLENDDPLVQFIDQVYIYGGYEPYISPIDFGDLNNFGPKRFSVPFVYRKEGTTDTGLYTLAMSNFLAETVSFFLQSQKMTTFVSDSDFKWKQFNSDKTYYMDIVLEKSPDLVMMEAYHSELHPTGSNGEKMNGRYFGYPTNKTDKALWGGAEFTEEERRLIHNDPAYAPYTPPYFEGEARARISFKPSGTSRAYTVQEIFDEAQVENIFVDVSKGATANSDAYLNKMPIGSSLEIFGSAQGTEITIDELTGQRSIRELPDTQNWIISPRMETPVLDFSSQELESYSNNYSKTGGFGRGMWSGYGQVPSSGSGVKMRLEYPYSTISSPLTASLLEQVGFKAEEKNIGSIADSKEISEAIVLVPYLKKRDLNYCVSKNVCGFNFIKIERSNFEQQLKNIKQEKPAVIANSEQGIEQDIRETSISQMIQKIEKYIVPPEMNFLHYKDIEPFVMYVFEFEHVLQQQDLADIWQGVMPDISRIAEKDEISIAHPSGPYEFFEGKTMPDDLRWLIFKVKRKAKINYFDITSTTKDDSRFNFNKIIGREQGTDIYSYNWPYDYFSLVELAKVELKLDYKAKETEE